MNFRIVKFFALSCIIVTKIHLKSLNSLLFFILSKACYSDTHIALCESRSMGEDGDYHYKNSMNSYQ